MSEPTLDMTILASLVETAGDEFVRSLIDDFIAESGEMIDVMHKALAVHDAATLHRAAHTLKSSGGYLGVTALTVRARDLEAISHGGSLADASLVSQLSGLDAEFELARAALTAWQQSAS